MRPISTLLLVGLGTTATLALTAGEGAAAAPAAPTTATAASRTYNVDLSHSNVMFRVKHLGVSYQWGRFDDFSGSFTLDDDASKSSVSVTVKAESVNSNSGGRDEHLRGPDFFSVKEFPEMTFQSKSVSMKGDDYEIKGDLSMHGVTKEVTMMATLVGEEETKMGQRAGFEGKFTIDRTDFGMKLYPEAIGSDVTMMFAIEGTLAN